MKSDSELAVLFAALAHASRIAVLRNLLERGPRGRNFGELAKALEMSPSTLTHHLREMEHAGVLRREVMGRKTRLILELDVLDGAVTHLRHLCCLDEIEANSN